MKKRTTTILTLQVKMTLPEGVNAFDAMEFVRVAIGTSKINPTGKFKPLTTSPTVSLIKKETVTTYGKS